MNAEHSAFRLSLGIVWNAKKGKSVHFFHTFSGALAIFGGWLAGWPGPLRGQRAGERLSSGSS
jgi:hypothetical protein